MGNYRSIVVLTGAGVSAESGIQTFRASDGLWHNHRVEDVASPRAFQRNPKLVHDFYNVRRSGLLDPSIQPNKAHKALAELEKEFNGDFLLVTQNIDDLHERGGSSKLIHMHGELLKKRCNVCSDVTEIRDDLSVESTCEKCGATGTVRPHIVWFEEMPFHMQEIMSRLYKCDLFIAIGTSGKVYPAAGFVEAANEAGAHSVELNLEPSDRHSAFKECRFGKATEVVPQFVSEILLD